jgi:chromosome segregation protein
MDYERIRADLRLLMRDWYGYHWHRIQQEILHAREVVHAQDGRLERSRERQAEVEVQIGDLRGQIGLLRSELNQWHGKSAGLHSEWEKVSRSLAVMDERQRALLRQQQDLQNDINRLEEEGKARRVRLQDLVEERDRLDAELEDAQSQVETARKALEKRLNERGQMEQTIRDTRRSLVQAETAQVQHKAHQNELTNRVESLGKNQQSLAQTLNNETQLLEQLKAQQEKQARLREQAEQAYKTAEEVLQAHRESISDLETRRKQAQDERARVESERARLAAQLEVLQQAEHSLSGLANGAKFLLQEARLGRLKGQYQPLSSQMIVPAEFEMAIAAALGEFLDVLLVEDGADPDQAIQLISKADKGRAVLLPLHWAREVEPLSLPEDDSDCIGAADRLVKVPEKLQQALYLLLGQVLVVRDRAAARRLVGRLPSGARAVTLQGEVFHAAGPVVAGPENRGSAVGRPRRIQEMQAQAADAALRTEAAQQTLQENEATIGKERLKERDLEIAIRQAAQELSKANQEHQQAILQVEQVRQRHE